MARNNVRISTALAIVLSFVGVIVLTVFLFLWWHDARALDELSMKEMQLRKELIQINSYASWTDNYYRTYKALNSLVGSKMSDHKKIRLTERIWMISRNYNFDPLLILAVVSTESRGNPKARGRKNSGEESGAYGLMQLKVETARHIGARFGIDIQNEQDLLRPEVNVVIGSAYLMRLIGRYGDLQRALIAYNEGPAALENKLRKKSSLRSFYYERLLTEYRRLVAVAGGNRTPPSSFF